MTSHRRFLPPKSRFSRTFNTMGYLSIAFAGAIIIAGGTFPLLYEVMSAFLIVGGILSAGGQSTGRWAGEFMGLPLLISAMWAFAVLTERDSGLTMLSVPSILLLAAYGIFMGSRWLDVAAVSRAARLQARRDGEEQSWT